MAYAIGAYLCCIFRRYNGAMASNRRSLREDEEFVRSCLERELGVEVLQHDDGSSDSMFDLEIRYSSDKTAPVEVTTEVDPKYMATVKNRLWEELPWPAQNLNTSWILTTFDG